MDKKVDNKKQDKIKKAVALRYNTSKDNAPRIVASGKGTIAEKIMETARKHDIPIEKDQDIVDALIRLNIGTEIPQELYKVIAEILSFIYKLEGLK
ncbi:FlhB-like flagellar biosynthesis protein [Halothermothrix orenii]|uniref:FlhB domain protein n=1 Tax=Halothermothrix orenii (strain H 168 / OCM 544 / DSM 9562) TaxID=373903 RepID=B8CZM1_HALOH|nr:FlhB-like flagellar biosynthesis protein [Halothermothrix orenii]ACL70740.1 FlhB domain protein [Halothermothrix orenii H 168]